MSDSSLRSVWSSVLCGLHVPLRMSVANIPLKGCYLDEYALFHAASNMPHNFLSQLSTISMRAPPPLCDVLTDTLVWRGVLPLSELPDLQLLLTRLARNSLLFRPAGKRELKPLSLERILPFGQLSQFHIFVYEYLTWCNLPVIRHFYCAWYKIDELMQAVSRPIRHKILAEYNAARRVLLADFQFSQLPHSAQAALLAAKREKEQKQSDGEMDMSRLKANHPNTIFPQDAAFDAGSIIMSDLDDKLYPVDDWEGPFNTPESAYHMGGLVRKVFRSMPAATHQLQMFALLACVVYQHSIMQAYYLIDYYFDYTTRISVQDFLVRALLTHVDFTTKQSKRERGLWLQLLDMLELSEKANNPNKKEEPSKVMIASVLLDVGQMLLRFVPTTELFNTVWTPPFLIRSDLQGSSRSHLPSYLIAAYHAYWRRRAAHLAGDSTLEDDNDVRIIMWLLQVMMKLYKHLRQKQVGNPKDHDLHVSTTTVIYHIFALHMFYYESFPSEFGEFLKKENNETGPLSLFFQLLLWYSGLTQDPPMIIMKRLLQLQEDSSFFTGSFYTFFTQPDNNNAIVQGSHNLEHLSLLLSPFSGILLYCRYSNIEQYEMKIQQQQQRVIWDSTCEMLLRVAFDPETPSILQFSPAVRASFLLAKGSSNSLAICLALSLGASPADCLLSWLKLSQPELLQGIAELPPPGRTVDFLDRTTPLEQALTRLIRAGCFYSLLYGFRVFAPTNIILAAIAFIQAFAQRRYSDCSSPLKYLCHLLNLTSDLKQPTFGTHHFFSVSNVPNAQERNQMAYDWTCHIVVMMMRSGLLIGMDQVPSSHRTNLLQRTSKGYVNYHKGLDITDYDRNFLYDLFASHKFTFISQVLSIIPPTVSSSILLNIKSIQSDATAFRQQTAQQRSARKVLQTYQDNETFYVAKLNEIQSLLDMERIVGISHGERVRFVKSVYHEVNEVQLQPHLCAALFYQFTLHFYPNSHLQPDSLVPLSTSTSLRAQISNSIHLSQFLSNNPLVIEHLTERDTCEYEISLLYLAFLFWTECAQDNQESEHVIMHEQQAAAATHQSQLELEEKLLRQKQYQFILSRIQGRIYWLMVSHKIKSVTIDMNLDSDKKSSNSKNDSSNHTPPIVVDFEDIESLHRSAVLPPPTHPTSPTATQSSNASTYSRPCLSFGMEKFHLLQGLQFFPWNGGIHAHSTDQLMVAQAQRRAEALAKDEDIDVAQLSKEDMKQLGEQSVDTKFLLCLIEELIRQLKFKTAFDLLQDVLERFPLSRLTPRVQAALSLVDSLHLLFYISHPHLSTLRLNHVLNTRSGGKFADPVTPTDPSFETPQYTSIYKQLLNWTISKHQLAYQEQQWSRMSWYNTHEELRLETLLLQRILVESSSIFKSLFLSVFLAEKSASVTTVYSRTRPFSLSYEIVNTLGFDMERPPADQELNVEDMDHWLVSLDEAARVELLDRFVVMASQPHHSNILQATSTSTTISSAPSPANNTRLALMQRLTARHVPLVCEIAQALAVAVRVAKIDMLKNERKKPTNEKGIKITPKQFINAFATLLLKCRVTSNRLASLIPLHYALPSRPPPDHISPTLSFMLQLSDALNMSILHLLNYSPSEILLLLWQKGQRQNMSVVLSSGQLYYHFQNHPNFHETADNEIQSSDLCAAVVESFMISLSAILQLSGPPCASAAFADAPWWSRDDYLGFIRLVDRTTPMGLATLATAFRAQAFVIIKARDPNSAIASNTLNQAETVSNLLQWWTTASRKQGAGAASQDFVRLSPCSLIEFELLYASYLAYMCAGRTLEMRQVQNDIRSGFEALFERLSVVHTRQAAAFGATGNQINAISVTGGAKAKQQQVHPAILITPPPFVNATFEQISDSYLARFEFERSMKFLNGSESREIWGTLWNQYKAKIPTIFK